MASTSRFSANGHVDGIAGDGAFLPGVDVDVEVANGVGSRAGDESRAGPEGVKKENEKEKEETKDRDESGRFAKGNKGGPGNPYRRGVAMLKRWLLEVVGEKEVKAIGKKLVEMAVEGEVAAARVLFQYVLPKNVEPDEVDVEEWELLKKEGSIFSELPGMMTKPGPELALEMVRGARPMATESVRRMTTNLLLTPQEKIGEVQEMLRSDPRSAREYLDRAPSQRDSRNQKGKKAKRGKR